MRPIRNSAKAIIIEGAELLAVKLIDDEGFWYCLPGGGQEPGEPITDALRRECLEEIGADVEIGRLRFVRDYIGKNHEFAHIQPDVHAMELMFICRLAEGARPRVRPLPDTAQVGIERLEVAKLDSYRLYPLGLRALIARHEDPAVPVYLGDIYQPAGEDQPVDLHGNIASMKAVVAVVQGQDSIKLGNALRQKDIPFTTIDSTGGFLRERNSTFMMAMPEDQLQKVLDVIAANCHTRSEYVSSYPSAFDPAEFYMPRPIEVQVGGASVWVLDVEYFESL